MAPEWFDHWTTWAGRILLSVRWEMSTSLSMVILYGWGVEAGVAASTCG